MVMATVITRLLDSLPRIYLIAIPLAYIAFFLLALPTHATTETTYDLMYRFVLYAPYAIGVTIIFIGKILLCRRSDDGLVAKWLVTVTYATGCFSATMWGVVFLLIINNLQLSFLGFLNHEAVLRGLSSALVGGGMVGEIIAAFVIVHGFKTNTLGRRIRPWIK